MAWDLASLRSSFCQILSAHPDPESAELCVYYSKRTFGVKQPAEQTLISQIQSHNRQVAQLNQTFWRSKLRFLKALESFQSLHVREFSSLEAALTLMILAKHDKEEHVRRAWESLEAQQIGSLKT